MAGKKMALGRGLNVLIPEQKKTESENSSPKEVIKEVVKEVVKEVPKEITLKLSDIEPNRNQPRKQFTEDGLEELAESIRRFGILQPLLVQKKEDYYEIIAGERRWRAARMAGLKEVPVIIRDYEDQITLEISLIENIQRENLNPIEEAKAYERLTQEFHLKQEEVANRVSKSRTAITNTMRLLKLDNRVQSMLQDELISTGHARCLLGLNEEEKQYAVAVKIMDMGLSVREAEELVKKENATEQVNKKEESNQNDFLYRELEEHMKEKFGTKVSIKNKKNHKGKIEIEYYSQEELERIAEMINSI
jgi:ParB family chromosome partitioning protein